MTIEKRMKIICVIEKMEKNEKFSKKLGLKDKSYLKLDKEYGGNRKW